MVDLPAPFCPIKPCTSPLATSSDAADSAGIPAKALLIDRIESSGADEGTVEVVVIAAAHSPGKRRSAETPIG
jgi:hypothetical protein